MKLPKDTKKARDNARRTSSILWGAATALDVYEYHDKKFINKLRKLADELHALGSEQEENK